MADGNLAIDGTINQHLFEIPISIYGQEEIATLDVLTIANHDIIIGADWLQKHKAIISWSDKSVTFPTKQSPELTPSSLSATSSNVCQDESQLIFTVLPTICQPLTNKQNLPELTPSSLSATSSNVCQDESQLIFTNLPELTPPSLLATSSNVCQDASQLKFTVLQNSSQTLINEQQSLKSMPLSLSTTSKDNCLDKSPQISTTKLTMTTPENQSKKHNIPDLKETDIKYNPRQYQTIDNIALVDKVHFKNLLTNNENKIYAITIKQL
jgi:hypothetical protein